MSDDRRGTGRPEPAGELLQRVLRRGGVLERVRDGQAVNAWAEAVGPLIARDARAVACERGVLTVETREATQRHTLQSMSAAIAEKINRALGAEVVRRIRFRSATSDSLGPRPQPEEAAAAPTEDERASVAITEADRRWMDDLVAPIANEAVRERTLAALETQLRTEKVLLARGWTLCAACGTLLPQGSPTTRCGPCATYGYDTQRRADNIPPDQGSE